MTLRKIYFLGFLISVGLLGGAYYFQYVRHLVPCPLCIQQRLAYYVLAIIFLLGSYWRSTRVKRWVIAAIATFASVYGLAIAARQVYLQHSPDFSSMGCAPSMSFMLHNFPLHTLIKTLFYGAGDCALVPWRFWGLSMAEWSLLCLLAFLVVSVGLLVNARKKK